MQKEQKKSEREIQISKENSKISQRIMVEETRIKGKKAEIMDSIKNKNNDKKDNNNKDIKQVKEEDKNKDKKEKKIYKKKQRKR